MMKYIGAKAVQPLPDFRLLITFEDGEQRIFNLRPYLDQGIFRELRDSALFAGARINFDTVEWPNGADLCPETLYAESQPVETTSGAEVK